MDKIKNIINKISFLYDNFNNNTIERDILLGNIRELYSEILLISIDKLEIEKKHIDEIDKQKIAEYNKQEEIKNNNIYKTQKNNITIGETLRQGEMSLYDKLTNQKQKGITDKIQETVITDILSAIPLGDRFLYTKEFFNNDAALFTEAILNIEKQKNFEDAINFLMHNYNVKEENENLISFLNVIRRKFL